MYNMVPLSTYIYIYIYIYIYVLHIWKLLENRPEKFSSQKKICNYVWWHVLARLVVIIVQYIQIAITFYTWN